MNIKRELDKLTRKINRKTGAKNFVSYIFYFLAAILGVFSMALLLVVVAPANLSTQIENLLSQIPVLGTMIDYAAFRADKLNAIFLFASLVVGWIGACFFHAKKVLWMRWLRILCGWIYWIGFSAILVVPVLLQVNEFSLNGIKSWVNTNGEAQAYWIKIVASTLTLMIVYVANTFGTNTLTNDFNQNKKGKNKLKERLVGSSSSYVLSASITLVTMVFYVSKISFVVTFLSMAMVFILNVLKISINAKLTEKAWYRLQKNTIAGWKQSQEDAMRLIEQYERDYAEQAEEYVAIIEDLKTTLHETPEDLANEYISSGKLTAE